MGMRDDEVIISGPAGTGKSRGLLEKVHRMMIKYPGARALLLRQTAVSLASTGLQTFRKFVINSHMLTGEVEYYGGSMTDPPQYRYENGSAVMFGGMDKPTKIMSSEYDVIYWQECTEGTEEGWEFASTRLRNGVVPYQQMLADANPNTPWHWVKQRAESGKAVMLDSAHWENPMLYDVLPGGERRLTVRGRAYIAKLEALTGVRRLRLLDGLWVAADGLVYDEFDPRLHVIDPFEPPMDWARWWVVDFGYEAPFVLQQWAEDGEGRLYLYREIFHTRRTVDMHAKTIMSIVAPDGVWREPKPRGIICDHDAENRAVLAREVGLTTIPARKGKGSKPIGIEDVKRYLRPNDGDGRPRLFLMRGCTIERDQRLLDDKLPASTAEEFLGYVWRVIDGKPVKDEPLKENDHGMDTVRYLCNYRAKGDWKFRG